MTSRRRWAFVAAAAGVVGCAAGAGGYGVGGGGNAPGAVVTEVTPPAGEEGFRYPMTAERFEYERFDSLITTHQGGITQVQTFGRTAFLSVRTEPDSGGGYRVFFALDSIRRDPRSTMFQPALDSAQGVRWSALMAPSGGLDSIRVEGGSTLAANLSGELSRLFFPAIPAGGLAIGSEWDDTAQVVIGGLSVNLTERASTHYRVPEQTVPREEPSLRIQGLAQLARTGADSSTGQVIEATGAGIDSTLFFLGQGGRFLGVEGADSVGMVFTVPAVGQSVPVQQFGRYRIRREAEPEEQRPDEN